MSDSLKVNIGDEIPVTLTMQGPEKTGTNQFGNWYLYRFNHYGEKVAYFAKDQMHIKLKDLDANTKVTLVGKNNPQGKGVYVDMVLANGHTTPTPTRLTTTRPPPGEVLPSRRGTLRPVRPPEPGRTPGISQD